MNEFTNVLINMQKRLEGKLAVRSMLVDEFFPLTHNDFTVKRAPNQDHIYHVVRDSDKKWFSCKYENKSIAFKAGTFEF